jgi:serine/threonine-protein kinase
VQPSLALEEFLAGTPEYMAPGQAKGRANVRTDVFGLGAVLYEILTGDPPDGPRRFDRRGPGIPAAACLKALSADPRLRQASAAELAQDVRRYLGRRESWLSRMGFTRLPEAGSP